jgi:biopolymer transport protein ExbD
MKIAKRAATEMSGECDMTPMIDMTFQLIIFLMLMVNFSQADQDAAILLPSSELAKPPDKPLETPITLNVVKDGSIIVAGQRHQPEGLRSVLAREADSLTSQGKSTADAHIIIRGHGEAPVGKIQEVIKICQEARFERFALRAKEED